MYRQAARGPACPTLSPATTEADGAFGIRHSAFGICSGSHHLTLGSVGGMRTGPD